MGYVNRKKNFHVLLSLLQHSQYELILAGRLDEPDYIHFIKDCAREMGVDDRLHLLGPVSEEEKSWYLQHCLAFMHPSLAEGFGAPVVEAMNFGKPLFLSEYTSLPEIAGDVAFYFSNFTPDHMNNVFSRGMETYNRNGLANRIMEKGAQYNWEEKVIEYVKVYRSLIQ
jgi:glycosyltransferase involved in cell wall biosynthesis